MSVRNCGNCSAWVPGAQMHAGDCRAHPPTPVAIITQSQPQPQPKLTLNGQKVPLAPTVNVNIQAFFPQMAAGAWCREWSEKGGVPLIGEAPEQEVTQPS